MMARSGRGWVIAALALYVAGILAILLSPVSPEAIVAETTRLLRDDLGFDAVRQGWVEFAANVALFVPFGALLALAFRRAWWGVLCALALSAGAEIAQIVLPGRTASPRDVLANVLGAAIGAAFALLVRAAARTARARRTRAGVSPVAEAWPTGEASTARTDRA